MADEIPVFPKASTLLIHTGNIVNWDRLKHKPNHTPTEELSECISATLSTHLKAADKNALQYVTLLDCVNFKFKETLPSEEREDLKLTVKLFLCSLQPADTIEEAIQRVLTELNVTFIETVLIAFPEFEDDDINLEIVKPYWKILEDFVHREVVLSVGISDLDKNQLEELYNWSEIKPVINQVNLASCCVMPKDLVTYAKENDIQLLTHNDPRNILPVKSLQDVIAQNSTEKDSENWEPLWALRYSVLVKCRGIIKTKGYIMKGSKDIKKRK
ncbi:hypothetical protein ScPMuIL_011625 [Solemya velum]